MMPEWLTWRWKWNPLLYAVTGLFILLISQAMPLAIGSVHVSPEHTYGDGDHRCDFGYDDQGRRISQGCIPMPSRMAFSVWGRSLADERFSPTAYMAFHPWFDGHFLGGGFAFLHWAAFSFAAATVAATASLWWARPGATRSFGAGALGLAGLLALAASVLFWLGVQQEMRSAEYIEWAHEPMWRGALIPALGGLSLALGAWSKWMHVHAESALPALAPPPGQA